jgi:hypothetical protein
MKTLLRSGLALALMLALVAPTSAAEAKKSSGSSTPGIEAAQTLSTVTGVAISPLLGVSAVGAYQWFKTPSDKRASLHWYAQPWFWLSGLLLVGFITAKDVLGTAAPTTLKKPFDVAEAVENKFSGLLAAGTFVPFMVTVFPTAADDASQALSQSGFAAISGGDLLNWMMVPFAIAIFLVVWLASHAVNMLILISPFTTVDAALKSFRASILGLVTVTAWINPWVGAFFSVIVVIVAWLIAGWAFRLLVLGNVYCWDFFTFRRHRFMPAANLNWMFAARALDDMPIRTYGRLNTGANGERTFEYRPWLVLPKRTLKLPADHYAIGRGIIYPEIMKVEGETALTRFILPPRYKGHEMELGRSAGITEVRDVGLLKGFKAISAGFRSMFGRDPKSATT